MREFFCLAAGIVRYDLAGAEEFPFINDKPFQTYRPAGVYLVGAYAHFSAEPVTEAVGEAGAAVPEHVCGIDQVHKPFGLFLISGNNAVGMSRAVMVNMVDCLFKAINDFYRKDIIQILGSPVFFGCGFNIYYLYCSFAAT